MVDFGISKGILDLLNAKERRKRPCRLCRNRTKLSKSIDFEGKRLGRTDLNKKRSESKIKVDLDKQANFLKLKRTSYPVREIEQSASRRSLRHQPGGNQANIDWGSWGHWWCWTDPCADRVAYDSECSGWEIEFIKLPILIRLTESLVDGRCGVRPSNLAAIHFGKKGHISKIEHPEPFERKPSGRPAILLRVTAIRS